MTTSHDPQRCACGHFQLPPARDACAIIAPGVSAQHGRLHCEQIELGKQRDRAAKLHSNAPHERWHRRTRGIEPVQLAQPREVRLSRLDTDGPDLGDMPRGGMS